MKFIYSGLALALSLTALSGCSSLQSARQNREFVIENSWARTTTKKDFLGFRRMNRMSPIVLDKLVIQANSIDGIVAYDRASGAQKWRMDLVNGVEGGAQVAGDRLFFGSSDGNFYCVNVVDGRVIWTFPVRSETLAPPTVDGNVVYFQNGADVLYALDAQTGRQIWIYNRQVTGNLSIRATTRPVVAGDQVLAGFSDGFIVSFRKRDGGITWERKLGRSVRFHDVDTTPVIDGQTVYVASFDAALYALNLQTGDVQWTVDEGAYVPVTLGTDRFSDRLYYSTANGQILILEKRSGKQIGAIKIDRGIATQAVVFKSYLVYGESEGGLVVSQAENGQIVKRFEPGLGLVSKPSIVEGTSEAYFISNSANLYALKMGFVRFADQLPWQESM